MVLDGIRNSKSLKLKPLKYNQESTRNQETRVEFGQLIINPSALHLMLSACGIKIIYGIKITSGGKIASRLYH